MEWGVMCCGPSITPRRRGVCRDTSPRCLPAPQLGSVLLLSRPSSEALALRGSLCCRRNPLRKFLAPGALAGAQGCASPPWRWRCVRDWRSWCCAVSVLCCLPAVPRHVLALMVWHWHQLGLGASSTGMLLPGDQAALDAPRAVGCAGAQSCAGWAVLWGCLTLWRGSGAQAVPAATVGTQHREGHAASLGMAPNQQQWLQLLPGSLLEQNLGDPGALVAPSLSRGVTAVSTDGSGTSTSLCQGAAAPQGAPPLPKSCTSSSHPAARCLLLAVILMLSEFWFQSSKPWPVHRVLPWFSLFPKGCCWRGREDWLGRKET